MSHKGLHGPVEWLLQKQLSLQEIIRSKNTDRLRSARVTFMFSLKALPCPSFLPRQVCLQIFHHFFLLSRVREGCGGGTSAGLMLGWVASSCPQETTTTSSGRQLNLCRPASDLLCACLSGMISCVTNLETSGI